MQRSKILAGTAVAAAMALSLAACSSGSPNGAAAMTSHGPITIWYSNNAQEVSWGKTMVADWNASHKSEQISGQEVPAGKTTEEVIGAAITAGTTPCLVFNNLPAATGQFEQQGGLVDLSKFAGANAYIQARSGATADQYKSPNGDFYQMPWKSNPVMIFYNKAIFKKAGLNPNDPKLATYAEFLAAAQKVKSSGAAPYAIYPAPTSEFFQPNFDFLPLYAAATGGKGLIENGKATITSPAAVQVADFWKTIYADGLAGKEQFQGDPFATGKAAMAIVGPWAISVYKGAVNWGSVPVPTPTGTPASKTWTFPDAKNIGMYTSCKNQGTAWDVMKFATSQAQDGDLLQATGQMPIRTNLQATYPAYFAANPSYASFADQAARTVDDPSGTNTISELQAFRNAYSKAVISGQGSVSAALQGAATQINSLAAQN